MKKFKRYTETGLGISNNGRLLYPNENQFTHMSAVNIGDCIFTGISPYQPPYISLDYVWIVESLPIIKGDVCCFDVKNIKTNKTSKMFTTDFNYHIANSPIQPTKEYLSYNKLTHEQVEEILQEKTYDKIKKEYKELPKSSLKDFPDFGYYFYEHTSKYYKEKHCIHVSKFGIFEYAHQVDLISNKVLKGSWKKKSNTLFTYFTNTKFEFFRNYDNLTFSYDVFPKCIVDKVE